MSDSNVTDIFAIGTGLCSVSDLCVDTGNLLLNTKLGPWRAKIGLSLLMYGALIF